LRPILRSEQATENKRLALPAVKDGETFTELSSYLGIYFHRKKTLASQVVESNEAKLSF
jgi:hypothetical protein